MNSIVSPKRELDDPDRLIDCQQAIESRFLELLPPGHFSALHDEAVAAGWTAAEVRASILALAHAALSAELGDEI